MSGVARTHYSGALAQLGERNTGSVEVSGSIPLGSTNSYLLVVYFLFSSVCVFQCRYFSTPLFITAAMGFPQLWFSIVWVCTRLLVRKADAKKPAVAGFCFLCLAVDSFLLAAGYLSAFSRRTFTDSPATAKS